MEDYIYIILGIVWVLVGFLGKKKKKTTAPVQRKETSAPEQTPQSQPKAEIETIFEDLFGESKPKSPEPEVQQVQEAKEMHSEYKGMEDYKFEHEMQEESTNQFEQIPEGTAVSKDYEFSSQKIETIEEMIKRIKTSDDIQVAELDAENEMNDNADYIDNAFIKEIISDPQKAIIYSEIINKRY
ncbi:MAG: hypothetical protein ACOCWC_04230 [Bacteroidota bacterium]